MAATRDSLQAPRHATCLTHAQRTHVHMPTQVTPDGTHPHQWSRPVDMDVWRCTNGANTSKAHGEWTSAVERVELYICHNGDLDFL